MKDEFILIFIERPQTDYNRQQAEAERIQQPRGFEHFAVKHTAPEHICYGVERVCHKSHFEKFVCNIKLVNAVKNRGHIKEQHTENLIEIFNILEEHLKSAQNKTDSHAQNQQNKYRNGGEKNIRCNVRLLVRKEVKINYEAGKHRERD